MTDNSRPDGYLELLETARALMERHDGPGAATAFGLDDLLAAPVPHREEELAVFAFLEAQGYCAARAPASVLSRFAARGLRVRSERPARFGQAVDGGRALVAGWRDGSALLLLDERHGVLAVEDPRRVPNVTTMEDSDYVVTLDIAGASVVEVLGSSVNAGAVRDAALTALRLGAAAEMLGTCSRQLDLAIEYAGTRKQFGSPLSSFTAVRDLLAWAAVERHQLVALLDAAIDAGSDEDRHLQAMAAKGLAGRVCRSVAQHTVQVMGGIGFTWEHDHHRLTRRSLALDVVGGSAASIARELGEGVRRTGELHDVVAL